MKRILFPALLVLLAPCVADAKCAYIPYTVTGIVSASDGAPILNAAVTLASDAAYGIQKTVAHTNAYGRYVAEILYTPNDDMPNPVNSEKPLCAERPSQVSVYVAAEGYEAFTSNIALRNERVTANYSLKRIATELSR